MIKWLEDAVFYEVYPQSFRDSNGDGIGDIPGITEKLEYIQELGCNALWINPCFTSPFYHAGYDVEDYYSVAPRYGTNEDLKKLFEAAHQRGMHVLLDLVPGHTAVTHPWFQESMKAEKNEYTDRYVWTDSVWNCPPGFSYLRGISERDGSVVVNFFTHQPALNYGFYDPDPAQPWQQPMDAPGPMQMRGELKNIMQHWLAMGCDGFRVDLAATLVKNDPDEKGVISLWQDVRAYLDSNFPEAALVSEWGIADHSLAAGFHMDFLLHFGPSHYNDLFRCEHPYFRADGMGSAKAFVERYLECYEKTAGRGLICLPSGNHDMYRLRSYLNDRQMRLAFAMILSFAGAPFVYYGDEIGMRHLEKLPSKEGGYHRTGARTPMQWDNTQLNCGFSGGDEADLYLPIDPDGGRPDVAGGLRDENSLLNEVRKLLSLRASHPALQNTARIRFLAYESFPLAYLRENDEERILVVINPGSACASFPFDGSGAVLYQIGGSVELKNGICTVDGETAVFVNL